MSEEVKRAIREAKIVAVVSVNDEKKAVKLGNLLVRCGISAMELTLRTPRAAECAKAVASECEGMKLGVGTILTAKQVESAKNAGAMFGVAPGCNPKIIEAAKDCGLFFAPGIMTPSEMEVSIELGCLMMKFFPAQSSGGIKHLESMAAPYKHLGVEFLPLGGLNLDNMGTYISSPLVCAIGGSWIAPSKAIEAEDWQLIEKNAMEASAKLKELAL